MIQWASNATDIGRAVGDVLLNSGGTTPRFITPNPRLNAVSYHDTLWRTGVHDLEIAYWLEHEHEERARIVRAAELLRKDYDAAYWITEGLMVEVPAATRTGLAASAREASQLRGAFCDNWLVRVG